VCVEGGKKPSPVATRRIVSGNFKGAKLRDMQKPAKDNEEADGMEGENDFA
jgi:hypothetical protein